jgi:hypothetical protein
MEGGRRDGGGFLPASAGRLRPCNQGVRSRAEFATRRWIKPERRGFKPTRFWVFDPLLTQRRRCGARPSPRPPGKLVFVTCDTEGSSKDPIMNFFGVKAEDAPVVVGFDTKSSKKYKLTEKITCARGGGVSKAPASLGGAGASGPAAR